LGVGAPQREENRGGEEAVNYATASNDTYFRDFHPFLFRRPPRERSESTLSLSPGAALGLTLLYSAGVCFGLWLTAAGLPW
jgi:hypothetical protein